MIRAGFVLFLVVGFAIEAVLVTVEQARRVRAEVAYWARHRPAELYDWAEELDL